MNEELVKRYYSTPAYLVVEKHHRPTMAYRHSTIASIQIDTVKVLFWTGVGGEDDTANVFDFETEEKANSFFKFLISLGHEREGDAR
jgi:hypothetical protein